MKRVVVLATIAFGLLSSTAMANTITVSPSPIITGGGPYTWSYSVTLDGNSQISNGDFFTIFDFAGYVAASQNAPAGWTPSTSNTGVCPAAAPFPTLCAAVDDPAITNLTWTRTGGTIAGAGFAGGTVALGNFTAQSIFNVPVNDFFTSQDDDLQTGTMNEGAGGNTNVPIAPVPEPASLLLLGSGLVAAAARARRKARQ